MHLAWIPLLLVASVGSPRPAAEVHRGPSTSTSSARLLTLEERSRTQAIDQELALIHRRHAVGHVLAGFGFATVGAPVLGVGVVAMLGVMVGTLTAGVGGTFGSGFLAAMSMLGVIPAAAWVVIGVVAVAGIVLAVAGIAHRTAERRESLPLARERRDIIHHALAGNPPAPSAPPLTVLEF